MPNFFSDMFSLTLDYANNNFNSDKAKKIQEAKKIIFKMTLDQLCQESLASPNKYNIFNKINNFVKFNVKNSSHNIELFELAAESAKLDILALAGEDNMECN